ncbi:MAG: hypothetical protein R3F60_22650 [bacterium]
MAEVTLKLRHDPRTGERVLVIHYESEDDALPHEHERDHRALVESLLGVPRASLADAIEVERDGRAGAATPVGTLEGGREAQKVGEG